MLIGPTPEQEAEILRLYALGLTQRAVGDRVHWSAALVRKVLKRHGVEIRQVKGRPGPSRPSAFEGDALERLCEMYRGGLSTEEIARRTGRAATTILVTLRRAGVEIRSKREACALARRQQLADRGRRVLTDRQRTLLAWLEERGPLTTRQLARMIGESTNATASTLERLALLGLVRGHRTNQTGRMYRWRRTELSMRDVLDYALAPDGKPDGTYLPIAPLRAWLEELIAREERKARFMAVTSETPGADGSSGLTTVGTVAQRMRVPDRVIWRLRHEQQTISEITADRLLQAYDDGTKIYDLWPELASDADPVAA